MSYSETSGQQRVAYGYLMEQVERTQARYEELRQAAQEAVDARDLALRVDHGEPDLPIMAMARLSGVLDRHSGKWPGSRRSDVA